MTDDGKKIESTEQFFSKRVRTGLRKAILSSALVSRASISSSLGKTFGGKRDLYESLGYPAFGGIKYQTYYEMYRRQDICGRLIDCLVDGAWQEKPKIVESKDEETKFEREWAELVKKYKLWSQLIKFDKLSRIGQYAVMLFGLDDVKTVDDLKKPVSNPKSLLYLKNYSEGNAEIAEWDKAVTSKRYGLPLVYKLTMSEPGDSKSSRKIDVHYSRVMHLVEGSLESEVYGIPYMERVYNRLINLETIVGGSAEMFWQGAFPGLAFIADEDADLTQASETLEEEIDLFVHDFKRYMKLVGLKVEQLTPNIADPTNAVITQLKMISIATGIPMRVLTGSERGQLASGQDESHWNDLLKSRRIDHVEPNIIRSFVSKMMDFNLLSSPSNGYEIEWSDLDTPTDKDKADIGLIRSKAIAEYFRNPETEFAIPLREYLEEILELEDTVVARIIAAAKDYVAGMITEEEFASKAESIGDESDGSGSDK